MVLCPNCRSQMRKREGKGHYGAKLPLFQCPDCSGLWVDGKVVRGMSYDSALETESAVKFEEIVTKPRVTQLPCPRCEFHLMEQSGGNLPKGLHIDYCQACEGYWFDKGELMIFKSHLEKKRQNLKQTEEKKRREKERTGWAGPPKQKGRSWQYAGGRVALGLAEDLINLL